MKISEIKKMFSDRWNREQVYSKADYWDSKASSFDGDAVSMWANNNLNRLYHIEHMKLIDENFRDLNGKRVLDVGCGTGYMSRKLAESGAIVTGIDFSEKAINIARQQSGEGQVDFQVMSAFDVEYESEFDLVLMWGCSVVAARDESELRVILQNIYQGLKPGGRVLILEPIHKGFLHFVLDMNFREYCSHVEDCGFSIHSTKQLHFWPFRFLLAYVNLPAFFTAPSYRIGQLFLKVPFFNSMGDYKAISASKSQ